ncbi:hypothetical protein NUM3379_09200 [Kineococcus sp. NUM-3379]
MSAAPRTSRRAAAVHTAATAVLFAAIVPDPFTRRRTGSGYRDYVTHQVRVDAVMRRLAPALSVLSAATGAAAVATSRGGAPALLRAAAVGAVAVAVAVTVRENVPVNRRLRSWSPDVEPAGWREDRAAWERAHTRRRLAVAAALACTLAAPRSARSG